MTRHTTAVDSRVVVDALLSQTPARTLRGADAAASGRATLEAAGVDVEALERRVGRPTVGGSRIAKGTRSPRVNVAVSEQIDKRLEALAKEKGSTRSELVREALDHYLLV